MEMERVAAWRFVGSKEWVDGAPHEGDILLGDIEIAYSRAVLSNGAELIASERMRQIEKGFTPELDQQRYGDRSGELVAAACSYAAFAVSSPRLREDVRNTKPLYWPWILSWWKPGSDDSNVSRVRELEKAGALIAAEIDRLLAAAPTGEVES